ncbi:MAG: membrane protein insertase YidC, partial [Thiohalorhabdaceae bacterium]
WLLSGFSYDGPVVFTGDEMQTYSHETLLERQGQGFQEPDPDGWAGIMSRYFLAAWLPDTDQDNLIYAQASGADSFAGYSSAFPRVAPGDKASVQQTLYLGPKEQALLNEAGRNLRRSVDYGILSFLAIPLFEVLQFFHGLVGNYGFAMLIKVIFFPLFSMSYRAMAKMRKVQPELQKLREQYGDDRQKLNEEMMRLYREEKVNPLGGCLPILVQIPVFISLYWVLLESVEIRHEPFMLWITDLTSQDPFYVLPVLMGASMVVQQLMNPAPLDPIQKKVMLALPVVFTVFFMQFPAGLVLYWLSNNLISIGQQWWIMRKVG